VNGNQFMMFNILERRFNILDFRLATGYLFIRAIYDCGVVFVILFTVILEEYFVDGFAPNHILRNGFS
jgi:hypothetical protein